VAAGGAEAAVAWGAGAGGAVVGVVGRVVDATVGAVVDPVVGLVPSLRVEAGLVETGTAAKPAFALSDSGACAAIARLPTMSTANIQLVFVFKMRSPAGLSRTASGAGRGRSRPSQCRYISVIGHIPATVTRDCPHFVFKPEGFFFGTFRSCRLLPGFPLG
jgi:hypothetical protein